jgi:hypothetical protein
MPILVNFNFKSNLKSINKYWPYMHYILNFKLNKSKFKTIMYTILIYIDFSN